MLLYKDCCINVMEKMIDKSIQIDLTVTSPPYDNLRTYENEIEWNFNTFKRIADNLYKITEVENWYETKKHLLEKTN